MRKPWIACTVLAVLVAAGAAWAAHTHVEITPEASPPWYHDLQSFTFVEDELFAIHDESWAVIVFYRPPEDVPAGFDLLNDFDPAVFDAPLLVGGSAEFDDEGNLWSSQVRGLGAVPVWFVDWQEIQDATADGMLPIEELEALPSLTKGVATKLEEQNHVLDTHPVSHLTMVARGTLEDGGSFFVKAVEVALELQVVEIDLE